MNDLVSVAKRVYDRLQSRIPKGRKALGTPLTLAEKILIGHLAGIDDGEVVLKRRESSVGLRPDRVAMQDATAQMALLQLMHAGIDRVAIPTTVHCDHLIRAHVGAEQDLRAILERNERHQQLSVSARSSATSGALAPLSFLGCVRGPDRARQSDMGDLGSIMICLGRNEL
jgi:aconitate hydratase